MTSAEITGSLKERLYLCDLYSLPSLMHRRFSSLVKPARASSSSATVDFADDDAESKISTIVRDDPLPPASSKVKRVDYYYSRWGKQWKYKNMNSKVTVETLPILGGGNNDPWKEYSFVLVRTIHQQENRQPTFKVVIKSEYILKACQDVIQTWPGISWNADPLEMEPETFLTWYQSFIEYRDALAARKARTEQETNIMSSVTTLLSFLATDFRSTLAQISRLTAHNEITFDLLYAILVPRTLIVARCAVTGLERLFRLESFTRTAVEGCPVYALSLEAVDLVDRPLTQSVGVGRVQASIFIPFFKGAARIDTLDAYPLRFHPNQNQLVETVKQRGQKWVGLLGIHHQEYDGIAAVKMLNRVVRHQVKGRIMVDRGTFQKNNPNYAFPTPVPPKADDSMVNGMHPNAPVMQFDVYGQPIMQTPGTGQGFGDGALIHSQAEAATETKELTDEELLLTPTIVYGFSLSDKTWLEFDVTKVQPVKWNKDAFANLVLPTDRKVLLQSLVEAHHQETGFDDFVKGKGAGLVVNLFGPPGVGKTFSAEATSEHVQRPLYVIGGGDLGTRAADLDVALERVFNVATAWKAIVLIDEADVFLERRSLHDLERNAMVAVFLRHVEYYRGILFLTTNRVQAFDEAFLSRIHVALHFSDLTESSRAQVWRAFIARAGVPVIEEEIGQLAKREVNGRQIKNAVRTAHSLALARKESVGFGHFLETLDAMDEFTAQFEGMKASQT
ncbi:AAA domain-containing protein [Mycena indigotica]|uniref:AAA domain-containing protein n=1 Tax=Mycena indigotica TaxID=2126181 RepID=A0A8H6W2G6_9AGAR|nr:AAA domain-containing protein [Mycena indigotica]KAF7296934.1 AAA domain-containing protein [Mycena indigotica]